MTADSLIFRIAAWPPRVVLGSVEIEPIGGDLVSG